MANRGDRPARPDRGAAPSSFDPGLQHPLSGHLAPSVILDYGKRRRIGRLPWSIFRSGTLRQPTARDVSGLAGEPDRVAPFGEFTRADHAAGRGTMRSCQVILPGQVISVGGTVRRSGPPEKSRPPLAPRGRGARLAGWRVGAYIRPHSVGRSPGCSRLCDREPHPVPLLPDIAPGSGTPQGERAESCQITHPIPCPNAPERSAGPTGARAELPGVLAAPGGSCWRNWKAGRC